jgi:His-Xaa-Ser system protein HxsD
VKVDLTIPEISSAPKADPIEIESSWSKSVVSSEAIERALYALADRATGTIADDGEAWRVTLISRGAEVDPASLAHALRQEVNDQSLRITIASRTDPVRNLVFALAFSRTGFVENPAEG